MIFWERERSEIEIADANARPAETDERVALLQKVIAFAAAARARLTAPLSRRTFLSRIAAIIGITETNVATKLNRLKQRVREDMLKLSRPCCFIWIPLILAIAYSVGADIWQRNPGGRRLAKNLEDNSVGRSVNRAQALLDEIAQFERES